jgi:hypothetical protein
VLDGGGVGKQKEEVDIMSIRERLNKKSFIKVSLDV